MVWDVTIPFLFLFKNLRGFDNMCTKTKERFSEVLESKRNRQTSFGNLNKKDPRANNRNYLKGKK